jgi:hypothetical protein
MKISKKYRSKKPITSKPMKKTSKPMKKTSKQIKKTSKQIKKTSKQIKKTSKQIKKTSKPMKKTSKPMKKTSIIVPPLKQYINLNPFSYFSSVTVQPSLSCNTLDLYKFSYTNINQITSCIQPGSLRGLNSNSASPSMTFTFNFSTGTNYDGQPVEKGFQKIYIDNVNELENKYRLKQHDRFPNLNSDALTYEALVYTHKIKPLLTNNINPHFVKGFGRQLNISFNDLVDYISANSGISKKDIKERLRYKCIDILSQVNNYFRDQNNNAITTGTIISHYSPISKYIEHRYKQQYVLEIELEQDLQKDIKFGMIISESNNMTKVHTFDEYRKMQKGQCITLDDFLGTFGKFHNNDYLSWFQNLYNLYFQITTAIYAMIENGINHNDLHTGNIFIKKVDSRINSYIINGTQYDLNVTHSVMIYDFDRAFIKDSLNPLNRWIKDNPSYDVINSKDMLQVFGNLYFWFDKTCDMPSSTNNLHNFIVICLLKRPLNTNDQKHMLYVFGGCDNINGKFQIKNSEEIGWVHRRVQPSESIFNDVPIVLQNIYNFITYYGQIPLSSPVSTGTYICPPTNQKIIDDLVTQNNMFNSLSKKYLTLNKMFRAYKISKHVLTFSHYFNEEYPFQYISNNDMEQLIKIDFGNAFNQSIDKLKLPNNVQVIVFGDSFNQPINNVKWPNKLRKILFGYSFNQRTNTIPSTVTIIDRNNMIQQVPPNSLELIFENHFNMDPNNYLLPYINNPNVKIIKFPDTFNYPINRVSWPNSLEQLLFGDNFDQEIKNEDRTSRIYNMNKLTVYVKKYHFNNYIDSDEFGNRLIKVLTYIIVLDQNKNPIIQVI